MSKQPPPAPTASAIGPCPTIIQISRTPRHWKFTQHLRTTRPPPSRLSTRTSSSCSSSARVSMSSANCIYVIFFAVYVNFSVMFFRGNSHNLFEKMWKGHHCLTPTCNCCSEPFSYSVVYLNSTCSLSAELLNGVN